MPLETSQTGIEDNLRFLIVEVKKQVERTRDYLRSSAPEVKGEIISRDDYIDNLKAIIHRKCFTSVAAASATGHNGIEVLHAFDTVATNLERIADFCERIVHQTRFIQNEDDYRRWDLDPFINEVWAGLSDVPDALFGRDADVALRICRSEHRLDELYAAVLRSILTELKNGGDTQTLVTVIFITRYFERMGDSLLNIGEAVISACLGEPIKIGQYSALVDSLESLNTLDTLEGISLAPLPETRSGTRIDRVSAPNGGNGGNGDPMVVLKQGQLAKLHEEKQSIDHWHEVMPGLAPKIYSFQEQGNSGALLFEFLEGQTFEQILLGGSVADVDRALHHLGQTLTDIWDKTRSGEPVSAGFARQLKDRLPDVYAVHQDYRDLTGGIGPITFPSFEVILARAQQIEAQLKVPFSVLIHGDFNIDNIIFDPRQDRVRFIDLHRSTMMDYVQDVSVFMVSNFRIQISDPAVRQRINHAILTFLDFAKGYAQHAGDRTFTARLALGLARSFATSTRFVLDESLAKAMFMRSRYLIERLIEMPPERIEQFDLPRDALVD